MTYCRYFLVGYSRKVTSLTALGVSGSLGGIEYLDTHEMAIGVVIKGDAFRYVL
jgi:hypothetical protein